MRKIRFDGEDQKTHFRYVSVTGLLDIQAVTWNRWLDTGMRMWSDVRAKIYKWESSIIETKFQAMKLKELIRSEFR